MDDAKETLGRWAAQLIAIVGLNVCGWGFLFHLHLAQVEHPGDTPLPLEVLLVPLLAIPFWRLLDLRRWAAWATCALLAWNCWGTYELLGQKGGRSWMSFLSQFWSHFSATLMCALAGAALVYILLGRPRVFRGGF